MSFTPKGLQLCLCGWIEQSQPSILLFYLRTDVEDLPCFLQGEIQSVTFVELDLFNIQLMTYFEYDQILQIVYFHFFFLFQCRLLMFDSLLDVRGDRHF